MRCLWSLPLLLFALLAGCGSQPTASVNVFAAASTGDVLKEIARDFEAESGVRIQISPAASSALAMQIENGADADLFLSADEEWADKIAKKYALQRRDLLANQLVVVVPADNAVTLGGLHDLEAAQYKRIAVARDGVPAGKYARDALRAEGVWDAIRSRTIEGGDVRATLNYVVMGEADAGFVYATDAASVDKAKVRIAYEVPESLHKPIRYPLLRIRRDKPNPAAQRFYDYLSGDKATAAFRRAGFKTLP
jgi:molybdate transport system substrate-binding protein